MATITPVAPAAPAPSTAVVESRLRLTHPTRGYAMTRNPFAIWEVLPAITLTFAALAIAMTYINDPYNARTAIGAFLVVTLGLLLVPALTLKGTLNLTHDGITFARGKDHFTAGWDQVVGVVNRIDSGLAVEMRNPQSTKQSWRMAGGFRVTGSEAQIPLRYFGDRQFSILYDIRDRLPDQAWRPALDKASRRPVWMILAVYGASVVICGLALYVVMLQFA
ncbi:MAG: hypothetical protein JOY80_05380 [Candidatus Dormibacteraeota bacterium]|nr:hypothetical protein [Candidatus Dormibacteraeota bacterium]